MNSKSHNLKPHISDLKVLPCETLWCSLLVAALWLVNSYCFYRNGASLLASGSWLLLSDFFFQKSDAFHYIPLDVKPYHPPPRVKKGLHVPHGLGGLEDPEGDGGTVLSCLVGDGQVLSVVRSDLDEQAVAAVAFVELSC